MRMTTLAGTWLRVDKRFTVNFGTGSDRPNLMFSRSSQRTTYVDRYRWLKLTVQLGLRAWGTTEKLPLTSRGEGLVSFVKVKLCTVRASTSIYGSRAPLNSITRRMEARIEDNYRRAAPWKFTRPVYPGRRIGMGTKAMAWIRSLQCSPLPGAWGIHNATQLPFDIWNK